MFQSMPGIERLSIDYLINEVREQYKFGVRSIDLFPVIHPENKDSLGSEALRQGNLLHRAIDAVKNAVPDICVMVDVALDPYTDHGHDGLVDSSGKILNDTTFVINKIFIAVNLTLFLASAGRCFGFDYYFYNTKC